MEKAEQIGFVNELIENSRKRIVANIEAGAPESWDGIELREYVKDYFAHTAAWKALSGKRKKEYKNTILISGNL